MNFDKLSDEQLCKLQALAIVFGEDGVELVNAIRSEYGRRGLRSPSCNAIEDNISIEEAYLFQTYLDMIMKSKLENDLSIRKELELARKCLNSAVRKMYIFAMTRFKIRNVG